ncbi:hypothetical protein C8Q79DRAFT_930473 [Trametes meyenii]|nr:hypothetical protein C8Q79DRAFT_930473 [Trametes meyenii]
MATYGDVPFTLTDICDFEQAFLPSSSVYEDATHGFPTDPIKDIRTECMNGRHNRWIKKEEISDVVLTAIETSKLAEVYYPAYRTIQSDNKIQANQAVIGLLFPGTGYDVDLPHDSRTHQSRARLAIQFDSGGMPYDPYTDEEPSPAIKRSREETLQQMLKAVESTFKYQHRHFLFSLYINDGYLRIIRWDRFRVIVTQPVNYLEDHETLPRLLWRFARLTDEQQGLDASVTRVELSSEDYRLMDRLGQFDPTLDISDEEGVFLPRFPARNDATQAAAASTSAQPSASGSTPRSRTAQKDDDPRVFKRVRAAFRESLAKGWPRYRMKVGPEGREFLVGMPRCQNPRLFRRGYRCYIAVDCDTHKFVWLKDAWRPQNEGGNFEGAILQSFARDSKLKVPTVVCHGLVAQYRPSAERRPSRECSAAQALKIPEKRVTRSTARENGKVIGVKRARDEDEEGVKDRSEPKEESCDAVASEPSSAHYRLALKEIGIDLSEFTSGWQLVKLIFDCIRTHARAYKEYGILHGDISDGNILICPSIIQKDGREVVVWNGMLIDWELARFVSEDGRPLKRHRLTVGLPLSWEFSSIQRHRDSRRPLTVDDDIEAFVYVLLHTAVQYVRHTLPARAAGRYIHEFFETYRRFPNNVVDCSELKVKSVMDARLAFEGTDILFCDDGRAPVHPLNGLLFELFRRLQARYTVIEWDAQADSGDDDESDDEGDSENRPTCARQRPNGKPTRGTVKRDGRAAQGLKPPTARQRDLARGLQSHLAIVKLFSKYVLEQGWPLHDKVAGNQLPADFEHTRRIVDVPDGVPLPAKARARGRNASRKRAKIAGGNR